MSNMGENSIPVNDIPSPGSTNSTPNVIESLSTGSGNPSSLDKSQDKECHGPQLCDTSKLRSAVWEHFDKKIVKDVPRAFCKYCSSDLAAHGKSGTSHLWDHNKICMKKLPQRDLRQMVLKANQKKSDGNCVLTAAVYNLDFSRMELVKMIVLHEYPLSVVEHQGFRNYSSSLQPLFKVPSRNTIRSDILKMHADKIAGLSAYLEKMKGRVCITTDMWTAEHQTKGYMAITAHFIDDSWRLQQRLLRFLYVPAPHDRESISQYLVNCLMDWNIDRRLCTITLDNCSVNDGVVSLVAEKIGGSQLLLNGDYLHMRCAAHILNLIVQDGMSFIGKRVERIRESVLYWTATPKRLERFEEAARQLRIPCSKKLSLDVKTRWNSTYLMLESAFPYKDVFPRLRQRESRYKSLPSEEDWKIATDMCERLRLFYGVTKLFSGTKYPTANIFFKHVCKIKLALENWIMDTDEEVSKMATVMKEKFNKYWLVTNGIMGVANLLDPRYKKIMLEYYFKRIYGDEEALHEVKRIVDICSDLLEDCEREKMDQSDISGSSSMQKSTPDGIDEEEDDEDFVMFKSNKRARMTSFKSELDHYLDDDVFPADKDFNVLEWWKGHGVKYPFLQSVARDILAIPVTSVASESTFSTGGRLLSPYRNRLHPSTVEALACCQNWLWAKMESKKASAASAPQLCTDEEEGDIQDQIPGLLD